ncbi:Non-classical arabinogalactan protein 31 [Nymphaea thermarum]|nr:Non-classical arabinogalactan protein 31 [Nymphaea thermarum]
MASLVKSSVLLVALILCSWLSGGVEGTVTVKPSPAPRSRVAVEGVVYCKSCAYKDVDTLVGATPLLGATVKLVCNNSRVPTVVEGMTDKNGYFYIESSKVKVTSYGVHKCYLYLVSSAKSPCNIPTSLNGGMRGAPLLFERSLGGKPPTSLFAAGPFAFAPSICPPSASPPPGHSHGAPTPTPTPPSPPPHH